MKKLLDRYRANPTTENANRLLAYHSKHPFASILLTPEDQSVIDDAIGAVAPTEHDSEAAGDAYLAWAAARADSADWSAY